MEASDFEGRAAGGLSVNFKNFEVGHKLNNVNAACSSLSSTLGDNYAHTLISGGSLTLNAGSVRSGDATYVSTSSAVSVGWNSGCGAQQMNLFDFSAWKSYAESFNNYICGLTATGTCVLNGNVLTLTGSNQASEIFTCSASDFNAARSFAMSGISASADGITINVNGASVVFPSVSYSMFEQYAAKLVWNFCGATSINTQRLSWYGLMLAPQASVSTYSGSYRGSVITNNWSGGFQGNLTEVVCLPALYSEASIALPSMKKRTLRNFFGF